MGKIAVTAVMIIILKFLVYGIIEMLCKTGVEICNSINYRGKLIPAIGGIVFIPVLSLFMPVLSFIKPEHFLVYLSYLTLVSSMGFAGLIDDLTGEKNIKGYANHLKCIFKGIVTTGFVKALTGIAVSITISLKASGSIAEFIMNVLIISLFANTVNLFDLRPGRAIKVFMSMSFFIVFAGKERLDEALPVILLNVAALFYIGYDLNEKCMLGDTGANVLGVSLGYCSALLLRFEWKLILLLILLMLNVISEKISITALINRNKVLSYLDGLGRERIRTDD